MAAAFADRLTETLNEGLVGFYLIGSYALEDLQSDSDIDFLAVLAATPSPATVEELRSLHISMASRYSDRPFEGFYFDADDLRRHPDLSSRRGLHFLDGTLRENDAVCLVEWETLRRRGHRVTGRPVTELGVFDASADLPAFSRRNLLEYWAPWLERTAPHLMNSAVADHVAWAAAWCVLGIPRLYDAIADGDIVSKTEAGVRARSRFDPRWRAVIDAALEYRRRKDDDSVTQLAAMCTDALAFSKHALEAALALPR